jgi:hypothetical protein
MGVTWLFEKFESRSYITRTGYLNLDNHDSISEPGIWIFLNQGYQPKWLHPDTRRGGSIIPRFMWR